MPVGVRPRRLFFAPPVRENRQPSETDPYGTTAAEIETATGTVVQVFLFARSVTFAHLEREWIGRSLIITEVFPC